MLSNRAVKLALRKKYPENHIYFLKHYVVTNNCSSLVNSIIIQANTRIILGIKLLNIYGENNLLMKEQLSVKCRQESFIQCSRVIRAHLCIATTGESERAQPALFFWGGDIRRKCHAINYAWAQKKNFLIFGDEAKSLCICNNKDTFI